MRAEALIVKRQIKGIRLLTPVLSSFEEERENYSLGREPRGESEKKILKIVLSVFLRSSYL